MINNFLYDNRFTRRADPNVKYAHQNTQTRAEGSPLRSICALPPQGSVRSLKYQLHSVSGSTHVQTRRIKKGKKRGGLAFSMLAWLAWENLILSHPFLLTPQQKNISKYQRGKAWLTVRSRSSGGQVVFYVTTFDSGEVETSPWPQKTT